MFSNASERNGYVQAELNKKGFDALPHFVVKPKAKGAAPVVFLTNCCIYPFDEKKYARTKTKTYYRCTGEKDLLNVTAAVAVKLADQGIRTIIHLADGVEDRVEASFKLHPNAHLFHFIRGDIYSFSFLEELYDAAKRITEKDR